MESSDLKAGYLVSKNDTLAQPILSLPHPFRIFQHPIVEFPGVENYERRISCHLRAATIAHPNKKIAIKIASIFLPNINTTIASTVLTTAETPAAFRLRRFSFMLLTSASPHCGRHDGGR